MDTHTREYLEKVANSAWRRLRMSPPCDLRAVSEFLRVDVIYDSVLPGAAGLFVRGESGRGTIYIAESLPHQRQRMVWAHELAHAALRRPIPGMVCCEIATYSHSGETERICDEFARRLLVASEPLAREAEAIGHSAENDRTAILAVTFQVSYTLMRKRLAECGLDKLDKRDNG